MLERHLASALLEAPDLCARAIEGPRGLLAG